MFGIFKSKKDSNLEKTQQQLFEQQMEKTRLRLIEVIEISNKTQIHDIETKLSKTLAEKLAIETKRLADELETRTAAIAERLEAKTKEIADALELKTIKLAEDLAKETRRIADELKNNRS